MRRTYLEDSYLTSIGTEALDALSKGGEVWVAPRDLLFHPAGGGQPDDRGRITFGAQAYDVVGLTREKGKVFARFVMSEEDASDALWLLKSGEQFTCSIDWPYRFKAMRCHTGAHVVMSVLKRRVSDYAPKGMQISSALDQVDLAFAGTLDRALLGEIESQANSLISSGARVASEVYPSMEAAKAARPDLFRADGELQIRGDVRMLWIEGHDFNPCGGTHVRNVGEIGGVAIKSAALQAGVNTLVFSVAD